MFISVPVAHVNMFMPSQFLIFIIFSLLLPQLVYAIKGDQCGCDYPQHDCFLNKQTLENAINAYTAIPETWTTSSEAAQYGAVIGEWCTGRITNMQYLFYSTDASSGKKIFNEDISKWNTASVTNMLGLFRNASNFNISIGEWNVSSVSEMRFMFHEATNFNGELNGWDTSSVTNMNHMFRKASSFNRDLNWDVSKVQTINFLFRDATAFNGNIESWDTSSVTAMNFTFDGASSFNRDLNWDVSKVKSLRYAFRGASNFDGNIQNWATSQVTNFEGVFRNAISFNRDVSRWDISKAENMVGMFFGATAFKQNLCPWRADFPYSNAGGVFWNSGCTYKNKPNANDMFNFCSNTCNTEAPSDLPSQEPSLSLQPSTSPSDHPSKSISPSSNPSELPSVSLHPSSAPSQEPSLSLQPSASPSDNPSKSISPSSNPSETPSVSSMPSSLPSQEPSVSINPTSEPSLFPSKSLQPSETPSDNPSKSVSPSLNPSEAPSVSSIPSSSPSQQPSVSASPSSQPSLIPSKSLRPSISPSDNPSKSISPSSIPSEAPSVSSMPSPPPVAQFEMSFESTYSIDTGAENGADTLVGVDPTSSPFLQSLNDEVGTITCPTSNDSSSTTCETTTIYPVGQTRLRIRILKSQRSLQVNSELVVAFRTLLQVLCGTSTCLDAEALGTQIYNEATGALQSALQDGTFISAVKADFSSSQEIQNILDASTVSVTFGEVIIPILARYPSESPSDTPSTLPSDDPSTSPSEQPSVSLAPSESPSDLPSNQPSDLPSTEPSSEPSSTPSCSPSNSPTESPSVKDGINLFYPDWENGGETCRNDGDHPDYMEINPTQWLSSTLDACCKKFFGGFLYQQCIGAYPPDADDCTLLLYYPDWNGANEGCVADGQEPLYMLGNAQYFLSNTKEECCEKFYEWNYYPCTGTQPEGSGSYYPDWEGSPVTCKNDGNMPDYMLRPDSAPWYLFDTLKECCEKYFHFELKTCMGSSGTPVAGSNKWYVEYSVNTCVRDCTGASPCGGLVEGDWVETFSSKKACCDAKLWYYPDCIRTNNN